MSYISTVRARSFAAGLAALGFSTLATGLRERPGKRTAPKAQPGQAVGTLFISLGGNAQSRAAQSDSLSHLKETHVPIAQRHQSYRSQWRSMASKRSRLSGHIPNPTARNCAAKCRQSRILKHADAEVVEDGRTAQLPSRGYFSGRRVVTMNATWYDPYHDGSNDHGRT